MTANPPPRSGNRVRAVWLRFLLLLCLAAPLGAHDTPNSVVYLDFERDGVAAELTLPLIELQLAFGQPLLPDTDAIIPRHGDVLRAYLLAHIRPKAPDGRLWTVEVREMRIGPGPPQPDLIARVWMQPPSGASVRRFTFDYDVTSHEVRNHYAFILVRNDWDTAVFSSKPQPVGTVHFETLSVNVDRRQGSWWQGFRSVLGLGVHHIAEGTDHLLFLLVLLLPAPLLAAGRRWNGPAPLRQSLWRLFKIVTAFTVGHSLTLLVGATGWFTLPTQPVEILIAVSILVSAVHAIRPVFPGRETWVAAGFGLVHGLAFASSIAEFGFSPWHLALTVLGFNVGIELMQLVVVAATVPWLLLLSRTRFNAPVRIAGAAFGALAALAWIGQRAFAWPNPLEPAVNALAARSLWIVAALAALSALAAWRGGLKAEARLGAGREGS